MIHKAEQIYESGWSQLFLPAGAQFRAAGFVAPDFLSLWFLVEDDCDILIEIGQKDRRFYVAFDNEEVPELDTLTYLTTVLRDGVARHVYERKQ